MSHQTLPAKVELKCFDTVKYVDTNSPSPHSDISSINIRSLKPQMSLHYDGDGVLLTCSLPGSVKHDTTCNLYFGEGSHPVETTTMSKKMNSKKQWFCLFTVTLEDFQRFLHSVQQKEVSCDYRSESEPNSLSPRSDGYSLTDILERESIMTRTKSASTMSTESTVHMPTVCSPTTSVKPESVDHTFKSGTDAGLLPEHPKNPATESTVRSPTVCSPTTSVKPESDHTFKPGTDAGLLPEHPKNPATEASVWKSAVAVAGFVTLVVILLVLARFIKRRTELMAALQHHNLLLQMTLSA
ncbi:uncharacterized protein [Brachyistius frenatus]|uniref:uncharacterized protein isoform X3 n=1 Tax=Brachyistius frenatus TaxID=100188 RepID=UPI0037E9BE1E